MWPPAQYVGPSAAEVSMKVRILTQLAPLARSVSEALEAAGHEVEVRSQPAFACELRHTSATTARALSDLADQLRPLAPVSTRVGRLDEADVELHLGERKPLSGWDLKLHTDSAPLAERLRQRYAELGFAFDGVDEQDVESSRMTYGGATAFARQVIRWFLRQEGITVTEDKSWSDEDNDVWLYLRDPLFDGRDLRPHVGVHIVGDDFEQMELLAAALGEAGFAQVTFGADTDGGRKLSIELGPYRKHEANASLLRRTVADFLQGHAIDDERYPLVVEDGAGATAQICLPLQAVVDGRVPPYAGAFPDRWDVVLRTDDRTQVEAVRSAFEQAGYAVRFEPLEGPTVAFQARWGAAASQYPVVELVTRQLHALRDALEADESFRVVTTKAFDDDDPRIELTLPTTGLSRSGFLHHLRMACAEYDFTLRAPDPNAYRALTDAIGGYGFRGFRSTADSDYSDHALKYGGAPPQLIEHLADVIERVTGVRPAVEKAWGDTDHDIWLCVPSPSRTLTSLSSAPLLASLAAWFTDEEEEEGEARPFIEIGEHEVRIGHVHLPRGKSAHPLVPREELFDHYCVDQLTAETLLHVAESVSLGEPCLLEGETSVSKTSVVQLLGLLAQRPVVRLNLNGQTDTGELVGRYVPQNTASLPVEPEELLAAVELLEDESRFILERARDQGRTLSEVEIQQIVANERMTVRPWRWQDGLVVAAMRHGWWLVLDELNLAEPQILERLNSLLERHPTLVLTEHDNSVFGPGGHPVHPDFRIFATMNPAEYAGRSVLSPAYRDRWRAYRYVEAPGEAEYRAMLAFGVFGTEPDVRVLGRAYTGRQRTPPYGALAEVPQIERFLAALARFHAGLERAVGRSGGLGSRRRERYVFTRRGLLAVMDYLVSAVADADPVRAMRVALYRYYLGRVGQAEDRAVVIELLDAAGIGPHTWNLDGPLPDEDSEGEE